MNEWNFYQIPHTGVVESEFTSVSGVGDYVRDDVTIPIRRRMNMKISNFGALNIGPRMPETQDYTRTQLTFVDKDDSANISVITADEGVGQNVPGRGVTVEHDPYLWGSTVKKVRDDQFFRMTMDNNVAASGTGVEQPMFDVMDTNLVQADQMEQYKNYPTEGWRSFGGKYDFLPYTGVLGRPRGNSRE